jgi:hypothetical protein
MCKNGAIELIPSITNSKLLRDLPSDEPIYLLKSEIKVKEQVAVIRIKKKSLVG